MDTLERTTFPPAPPVPKRHVKGVVIAAIVAGAVGIGIGATAHPATDTTTSVPTTPAACIRALDAAETVVHLGGEGFTAAADGFTAVSNGDAAGLQAATDDMTALNPQITAGVAAYNALADECRSAA